MTYYDAEIEYLESTGTELINIDIILNDYNNTIETKITHLGYLGNLAYSSWFSSYTDENSNAYRIIRNNTSNTSILVYNGRKAGGGGTTFSINVGNTYDIKLYPTYGTINNTNITYSSSKGNQNKNSLKLFNHTKERIYYFKIIKEDAVILDLIPVRIGSVGYMYDKVSDTLFGNSGTGSFVLGPDVAGWPGMEGTHKVSLLRRKLLQFMPKYKPDYLCFTAIDKGTFSYTITSGFTTSQRSYVEYSIDDCNTWTRVNNVTNTAVTVTTPEITPGKKVYWKGVGTCSANNNSWTQYGRFSSTGRFNASGVLASFFYGDSFTVNSKTKGSYYAGRLFYNCTRLIHAKDLILSPNNYSYGYYSAFAGCTNMLTTPSLSNMGTLYECCYRDMFYNCKSITTLPLLPNTALANQCYYTMFSGCSGITSIPSDYLPATTLKSYCYYGMFQNCTNITIAPDLPATTLAAQCYTNMFYGCTKLIYIKMLATNISASQCFAWVYNINTSNGVFVRNPDATWWVVGQHGIPSGWVLEDGTEQDDDIIVFEDAEAKRVITSRYGGITPDATYRSHWPIRIRGKIDGEITYRQAAHIASITSAFENNTVVKKFHEFLYFTGIDGSGTKWFQNCTSLEEITLPNKNNLSIASNAFYGCRDLSIFNNWEKVTYLNASCFESSSGTFRNLTANLDLKNILNLGSRAFMYNTAVKKLYVPNVRTIGNFYAMVNCELIDVGHDNPITFNNGSLLFWGWSGTKTTNLVFRCPCYVRTDWSTANIHQNAPNMTFNLFVYQKYYNAYANDAYWSTADNIYVIGGEEWVSTFGSSDEWADYPNGQAPSIDLVESQVEYLRPKSNYAFTTSVTPTVNTKMVTKARYATLTNTEIAGTYSPTSQRFHFGCYSSKFYFGVGNTYKTVKAWDTNVHTFELSGDGTAVIDDTTYSIGGTLGTATATISIFARHGSSYAYTTSVEIYNFKIYEGEELIRDYIPYRYRGYACLKNKITGNISFMNPLSNFYVGADVTEE